MPLQLHIPELKDIIELAEDWTFTLHEERRNSPMWALMEPGYDRRAWLFRNPRTMEVTLAAGTQLVVDRIYIRAGSASFNSVTFRAKIDKKSIRFWAKLKDVNKIVMV